MASICRIVSATGPHCTAPEVRLQALPPTTITARHFGLRVDALPATRYQSYCCAQMQMEQMHKVRVVLVDCKLVPELSSLVAFARSACAIQGAAGASAVSRCMTLIMCSRKGLPLSSAPNWRRISCCVCYAKLSQQLFGNRTTGLFTYKSLPAYPETFFLCRALLHNDASRVDCVRASGHSVSDVVEQSG